MVNASLRPPWLSPRVSISARAPTDYQSPMRRVEARWAAMHNRLATARDTRALGGIAVLAPPKVHHVADLVPSGGHVLLATSFSLLAVLTD